MSFLSKRRAATAMRISRLEAELIQINRRLDLIREAMGRVEERQSINNTGLRLSDHEYKVFSQWGEDGIIQFLIRQLEIRQHVFVEFGVGNYSEANTRFLMVNNNWTGLVMDSDEQNIRELRRSEIAWRYGLRAVQAFITRENVNELITANGVSGDIGLLSVDIDGNDYWVWEAIDSVNPAIVIIEYNHRFGSELAVTIPYDENFRRGKRYPITYFGASLVGLCRLADKKGYALVGCNSNGVNAFFVRRDQLSGNLSELSAAEGYVAGNFTETRDENGLFIPSSAEPDKAELLNLPLIDVSDATSTQDR